MTLLVASLALAFTVGSFWWIQVRPGRLESYRPWVYAGAFVQGTMRMRLPIAIYNTGARTLVVTDVRLQWLDGDVIAPAISFRHSIRPDGEDFDDFCHPFAVPGRQVVSRFVEFGTDGSWLPEPSRQYDLRVEVRVGDSLGWEPLLPLQLTTPPSDKLGVYISHPTDPEAYAYRTAALDQANPGSS